MALDELRRNIEHEARDSASKLDKESAEECSAILENAKNAANEAKKKAREEALAEVERKKRDTLTELEIETNSVLSGAKEYNIDKYIAQFNAVIDRRLYAKEQEIIKAALKKFSDIMPLDEALVRIDKKNMKFLKSYGKADNGKIRGVVLSSIDGRVAVDATVEGIMASNADLTRRILSKEFS